MAGSVLNELCGDEVAGEAFEALREIAEASKLAAMDDGMSPYQKIADALDGALARFEPVEGASPETEHLLMGRQIL